MDERPGPGDGMVEERHRLTAGILDLSYRPPRSGPLFVVGERINPRRAFLFVSTLLGRHIPVAPGVHRAALEALAGQVLPHVGAGPVLVMSYAETAVGLGAGVARGLRRRLPGREILFLPTTRHAVPGRVWLDFSERHSHAREHLILDPGPHAAIDGEARGRTLILVDDETTTGRTFAALAGALIGEAGLAFERVVLVTLTNWSGAAAGAAVRACTDGAAVAEVTLMSGQWSWTPDRAAPQMDLPGPIVPGAPEWTPGAGRMQAPRLGEVETPAPALRDLALPAGPDQRVLVIGSGEHVWQPFLLAEAFEAAGAVVGFIATTRSPVLQGRAIRQKMVFPDHFGIGIEMYLHNVDPGAWDRILLCTETGADGIPGSLRSALGHGQILDGDGRVCPMVPA